MKRSPNASREKILKILSAPKMELKDLSLFFKEDEMPEIDPTPLGRYRLLQGLRNKFGDSYRNKKGVMRLIKDFDDQRDFIVKGLKARGYWLLLI